MVIVSNCLFFFNSIATIDAVRCQNGCLKVVNKVVIKVLYYFLIQYYVMARLARHWAFKQLLEVTGSNPGIFFSGCNFFYNNTVIKELNSYRYSINTANINKISLKTIYCLVLINTMKLKLPLSIIEFYL